MDKLDRDYRITSEDAINDNGQEIYNLMQAHGIDNVILLGAHTNICVSGRPFGLRQMVRFEKHVLLCRDLTDSFFQPRSSEFNHFRGTNLIIENIENTFIRRLYRRHPEVRRRFASKTTAQFDR